MHALEPSPEMAAVAERNCGRFPDVAVEFGEFESWDPGGRSFPLLYSAQAWHWIDPERRYPAARAALEPEGVLAAFWNRPVWDRSPLRDALEAVYARSAPDLAASGPMRPARWRSAGVWNRWAEEIGLSDGLERPAVRGYEWTKAYSTAHYLELLRTHSDHVVLDPGQRDRLLHGVAAVIDAAGGRLELTYVTQLCLARAV